MNLELRGDEMRRLETASIVSWSNPPIAEGGRYARLGMLNLNEVNMKSPIVLLRRLLIDFKRLDPDVKGLERDIITLEKRYKHEGYGFLSVALPALGLALQQGLSTGRFCCPDGFSKSKWGTLPLLFGGLFSEMFEPKTGLLKAEVCPSKLKSLYQVLFCFKKIQLSQESNDKLHTKAVTGFFANDLLAHEVVFPADKESKLRLLARYLMPKLRSYDFDTLKCKHGPGAVKEGLKGNQKWSSTVDAILTDGFCTEDYGFDNFAMYFEESLSDSSDSKLVLPKPRKAFDYRASSNSARLVSVPKSSTSNRTITVEPLLNQFIQQGMNTALRDSIVTCDVLQRCLTLTEQSVNQRLALFGSLNDEWSTLDLKSASDLLSSRLVETVFGSFPDFYRRMVACRTPSVSNGFSDVTLGKFAGMGNALTFPVQSICFALICIAAIMDDLSLRINKKNLMRVAGHVHVYGDDIIISAKHATSVVNWITSFGLQVNERKSFLAGNFKESCGVDAYKGTDIAPIYVKDRPDNICTEANSIAGLVSLSNQLWDGGYYAASDCIKHEVEERLGYSLPLVARNSSGLGWFTHLEASDATRWCRKLHTWLVKAPVVKSVTRTDRLDGWAALLKFFHVPLLGRSKNHLEKSEVRFQLRIVRRWVPAAQPSGGKSFSFMT
jgi:hypothetical protein